eukprot:GHVT01002361.1.p1 GENE.GHVT01002361.1~~GHVT01002361.1.p1  ORF type:complete len:956 (-),score=224.51 GHVT01002361.1:582-3449(-)
MGGCTMPSSLSPSFSSPSYSSSSCSSGHCCANRRPMAHRFWLCLSLAIVGLVSALPSEGAELLNALTGNSPPPEGEGPPLLQGVCNFRGINPCVAEAKCTPSVPVLGEAICICPPGFGGDGRRYDLGGRGCQDLNECMSPMTNNCDPATQVCVNTLGSFECRCREGYERAPDGTTCHDVNECKADRLNSCDPRHSRCVNTSGSYKCECFGERQIVDPKSGKCRDMNECSDEGGAMNPCTQLCFDTEPGVRCGCEAGWRLAEDQRTCVDVDECLEGNHTCDPTGRVSKCVNTNGDFKCECNQEMGFKNAENNKACVNLDECTTFAYVCGGPQTCCKDLPPPARFACISPESSSFSLPSLSNPVSGLLRSSPNGAGAQQSQGAYSNASHQGPGPASGVIASIMGVDTSVPFYNQNKQALPNSSPMVASPEAFRIAMQSMPPSGSQSSAYQPTGALVGSSAASVTGPTPRFSFPAVANGAAAAGGGGYATPRGAPATEPAERTLSIPADDFASIAVAAATALGCFQTGTKLVPKQQGEQQQQLPVKNQLLGSTRNAFDCQVFCYSTPGCDLFVFDTVSGACEHFASASSLNRVGSGSSISGPRNCSPSSASSSSTSALLLGPSSSSTGDAPTGEEAAIAGQAFTWAGDEPSPAGGEEPLSVADLAATFAGVIFNSQGPAGHLLDDVVAPLVLQNSISKDLLKLQRAHKQGITNDDGLLRVFSSAISSSRWVQLLSSVMSSFPRLASHPCSEVSAGMVCFVPPVGMPLGLFRRLVTQRLQPGASRSASAATAAKTDDIMAEPQVQPRQLQVFGSASALAGRIGSNFGNGITNHVQCPTGFALGSDVYKGQVRSQTRKAIRAIASGTGVDQHGNQVRATPELWTNAIMGNTNKAAGQASQWYSEIATVPAEMMGVAMSAGVPTSPQQFMQPLANPQAAFGAGGGTDLALQPTTLWTTDIE